MRFYGTSAYRDIVTMWLTLALTLRRINSKIRIGTRTYYGLQYRLSSK